MSRSFRKILFILVAAIILPFILFTAREVGSLNEEEQLMEEIYGRQLEAVLFSINQYSDDLISGMARQIEENAAELTDSINQGEADASMRPAYFFYLRAVDDHSVGKWRSFTWVDNEIWRPLADSILNHNIQMINRLVDYKKNGFRKIEPLSSLTLDSMDYSLMVFIVEHEDRQWHCLLALEPSLFTEFSLAPKMQEVAREDLVVMMRRKSDAQVLFATDSLYNNEIRARSLWLMPDHEIAISPHGRTMKEIIRDRTEVNIILSSSLGVLMLIGFWLVLSNVRKEMSLAQNKSDFVSNVSHEIRTPLSLISMFAETLQLNRVESPEKKQEYYSIIRKEAARLSRIVNRILNFSQIEAKKKSYNKETVDINELVKQVVNTYSFHLESKGFEYDVEYAEGLPTITGDSEAIIEAIINLLDNAIKYSEETKRVEISTGLEDEHLYIKVKDHGVGIDPARKKQIFEKFYRITKDDVHDTKGVGLGLSLVKHIVDAHQGTISLESTLGKGSQFSILLPKKLT